MAGVRFSFHWFLRKRSFHKNYFNIGKIELSELLKLKDLY